MSLYLKISANFRTGVTLPTIEDQYYDLWKLASVLSTIGLPISDWCPPADTPANSRLNAAFNTTGPTDAALAIARADKDNHAPDLRTLGVWNGQENVGGTTLTTMYNTGRIPSNLSLIEDGIPAFEDYQNVVELVRGIVEIWSPMLVKVTPWGYDDHKIFQDRPPVGWMIYLPFELTPQQVPEAAQVIVIADKQKKGISGTLLISTTDVFSAENPAHVQIANAIETRLVDQDLLPTLREFLTRF
ncbi:hypothetical protein GTP58_23350 [Duganella sp. CY15W]|uniref:Imm52 family immunity protein n=1 Tax=Duganella sp. CY15W TaxID=2692172 RepID=UPI00136844A2|nr:Imm52 family immunity protein [Duganella sp. CY15W]MYM31280.1 hypothetical protein [Duganella sp. CY15W]